GGCCGTTPEHIRQVVDRVWGKPPLPRHVPRVAKVASAITATRLAQDPAPTLIGERVNAQGSRAVKRMLLGDDYESILTIARDQVEGGGHLLDVCVALTERQDEAEQMRKLVKLLAQSVEAPLVIDSTEADVVAAALKQYPGRAIVNSINLENGLGKIESVMPHVMEHGAAVIALTIDEQGMAKTADRKVEIARRIHDIVTQDYGLDSDALIFDDLTFTLATGDAEFRRSAVETIEGIRAIKAALPGVLTSLGVSNVSFGLAKHARAILNSVFLHHCVEAGLDMAIVNPAHVTPYAEIDEEDRLIADDLIFDRREDALARFITRFENREVQEETAVDPTASMDADQALHWKILHRKKEGIEQLVDQAISNHGGGDAGGVWVLNNTLLPAMKEVGDKFGAGELILPFVLQSAEVMKKAVAKLETYLDKVEGQTKGKVVLATVFGDVHDIGKSLVNTILSNNGYTVYDLGKQVPVNTIIEKALEVKADAIGLSALLVSTSKQMPLCVQELHSRGLTFPVLCGGAAINPSFIRAASFVDTEQKQLYPSGVFYCKDAFEGLSTVEALLDPKRRVVFVEDRHQEVLEGIARRAALQEKARAARPASTTTPNRDIEVPTPPFFGVKKIERLPLADLFRYIDLNTLYRLHWGAKNAKGPEYERLVKDEFEPRLKRYQQEVLASGLVRPRALYGLFPAAAQGDDLVIFDPENADREIARFDFPRQLDREHLCLSDYFMPAGNGKRDVVALQLVTIGDELLEKSQNMMKSGDYSEGYFLHGFGVRLAEAAAEYVHRLIRKDLGIPINRGLRYSWGYPACPDHLQHEIVFRLLPARESLKMELTELGALVPELSTAALVVHHPDAKYFSAS
ncbi:MAG TPA: dihydropteroate synthase, partial [Longimicrobiales bacterium]|nr:dihydropteroate synthase [Longimicrobiales bacterium]